MLIPVTQPDRNTQSKRRATQGNAGTAVTGTAVTTTICSVLISLRLYRLRTAGLPLCRPVCFVLTNTLAVVKTRRTILLSGTNYNY